MNQLTTLDAAFDLSGRTALVTGAGSGLGRQFARVLARAGATLALCARRAEKLEETAAIIAGDGGEALCVTLDVTDPDSVRDAVDTVVSRSELPRILINNAGTNRPKFATDTTVDDWNSVLNTNLRGCFLMAKEIGSRLIEANFTGSIVNIASVLAFRTQKSVSAYMAAKGGLLQLSSSLALEWARYGIRVNTLVPGYFNTEITEEFLQSGPGRKIVANIPFGRVGELEELNGPILLLASDAGSFMTGSALVADGGHLISSL